jgi:hypothetical protein
MGSTETPPVDPPDSLQGRIEAAISQARQRDLLTTNAFWTIFHGMLGLGLEVTLYNPDTGQRVPALDYISNGGEVRGLRFFPTKYGLDVEGGQLGGPQQAFVGQGHQDQFLAEMAQWGLPTDHKFMVHGKNFTLQDFLNHTKMRARVSAKQELSWAILVIGQYFGTELAWENSEGEKLRFEDLLRYEMRASMDHAACGGTHRLFGLSWVYHLHLRKGGQPIGVWKEVADFTDSYKKKARDQQNPDGSFSVNFFRGPGYLPPDDQHAQVRMNTTGHIFEWLALAMTDEQLREPWVRNAADALAMMFLNIQGKSMEGGTLYHAVHGLIIYYARVFGTDKLAGHIPKVVLLPGCNLKTPGR